MKMHDISNLLLTAMVEAYKKYYELNDYESFIAWPEYFSTVNCAMKLKKILPYRGYIIELESRTNSVVLGSINSLRKKDFKQYKKKAQMIKDLRDAKRNGKVDIVVKENSGLSKPIMMVENKNFIKAKIRNNVAPLKDSIFNSILSDITRCCYFMKIGKFRKLDYCAITFYAKANLSKSKLSSQFKELSCLSLFNNIDFNLFSRNIHALVDYDNGEYVSEDYANAYVIQLTRTGKRFMRVI